MRLLCETCKILGLPAVALTLGGGCVDQLDDYRFDNAKIRERQAVQLMSTLPDPVEQEQLRKLTSRRVSLLIPKTPPGSPPTSSGRATAISSDGYYLTAAHAVQGGPTSLVEMTFTEKKPDGPVPIEQLDRFIRRDETAVRVVWRDPEADLAIVKAAEGHPDPFQLGDVELTRGDLLFTADDQGDGVLLTSGALRERIGNGPFAAAGPVLSVRQHGETTVIVADLTARGGMSGAPVVTRSGELAGILVRVSSRPFLPHPVRAEAAMITPEKINSILAEDRRRAATR